jgi:ABC-type transport system involved in cytochrome c biogenesis permease subunit
MFIVVLDEFAPFGYRNFAQILQTARDTQGFPLLNAKPATAYASWSGLQGRHYFSTFFGRVLISPSSGGVGILLPAGIVFSGLYNHDLYSRDVGEKATRKYKRPH